MNSSTLDPSYIVWDSHNTAQGPMNLPILASQVQEGLITAGTWIFLSKAGVWDRAGNLPELRALFNVYLSDLAAESDPGHNSIDVDISALRGNRLLSTFTDEQLDRFIKFVVAERFAQATVVVKQGESSSAMYLILEGELSVFMNFGGQETELATLGLGDFFGDFVLFDTAPRSASVIANRSCLLLRVSTSDFQKMSLEAPDLAIPFLFALGKTLTARIRTGNKHQGEATRMANLL
jgi:hypothetical protein